MTMDLITFILLFMAMWIALIFEAINHHRQANFMFRLVVMLTLIVIAIKIGVIVELLK